MKKCRYCGKENEDSATRCKHCFAGNPHETEQKTDEKPVKVSRKQRSE